MYYARMYSSTNLKGFLHSMTAINNLIKYLNIVLLGMEISTKYYLLSGYERFEIVDNLEASSQK